MRILYFEDNLAFHVEQMIEDLGYVSAGSLSSFAELQENLNCCCLMPPSWTLTLLMDRRDRRLRPG